MLALVVVVSSMCTAGASLRQAGYPVGHDLTAHLTYSYLFDRAIEQGQFPVRWTAGVRPGESQPLFNFYQPGFYYLVQIVHLATPSLATSVKLTVLALWWLGAGFVYLLCVGASGRIPALLAALMFGCAPYILLDVNVRAAYPELAALALAPGLLWAIDRAVAAPGPRTMVPTGVVGGLLLVCHLPSSLIFSPVFVAYAGRCLIHTAHRGRALAWLAAGGLLAVGLAAFYLLPALGELSFVQMRALTTEYFDYRDHFVQPRQWTTYSWGYGASVAGAGDKMSFQIGIVQVMALVTAVAVCGWALVARHHRRRNRLDRDLLFWMAVAAAALYMMTPWSAPVWRLVPPLAYVQFPWRFFTVVTVAVAVVSANLLARVTSRPAQAVILTVAAAALLILSHDQRRPLRYLPRADVDIDNVDWWRTQSGRKSAFLESGYHPSSVPLERRAVGAQRDQWAVVEGAAQVEPVATSDHALAFQVRAETDAVVVFGTHMFPGWRASIDEQPVETVAEPARGYIQVAVPRGTHRVDLTLENTRIRWLGNGVSLVSIGACLTLVGLGWRRGVGPAGVVRTLVSRHSGSWHKCRSAAPRSPGATSEHRGPM